MQPLQCYDIDECSDPVLNTCSGGLAPYGFSVDAAGKGLDKKFYVGPGEETYNHDFVFDAMGTASLFVKLCDGDGDTAACYVNQINEDKPKIKKDNIKMKDASISSSHWMSLKTNSFTAYRIKLQLSGSKLSIQLGSGYETWQEFLSWDDAGEHIAVEWVWIQAAANFYVPQYVRNFRRHGSTEVCSNNVGSFTCSSTEEEYMAIGYGGHTTSGSTYPSKFTVVTKDEYDCHNHKIPDLSPGRYAPAVQVMGNYLYVCGGHYYGAR